jgi:hypothetical protein
MAPRSKAKTLRQVGGGAVARRLTLIAPARKRRRRPRVNKTLKMSGLERFAANRLPFEACRVNDLATD